MTELCQYWKICKCYERESHLCNWSDSKREIFCSAYKSLLRSKDTSEYNRELKRKTLFDKIFGASIK